MNLEKIPTVLTVSSALIVFCGFSYNMIYYYNFNIDIAEFVDLTESLILFLPILPQLILLGGLVSFGLLILNPSNIENNPTVHDFYIFFYNKKNAVSIRAIISTILFYLLLLTPALVLKYYLMAAILLIGIIVFFAPFCLYLLYQKIRVHKNVPLMIFLAAFCLSAIYFFAQKSADRVFYNKRGLPHVQMIKKDNSSINTNDTIRYIGKTRSYIFLYNSIEKSTVVLPTEDIYTI